MRGTHKTVNVEFLGRHFDIRCPADKVEELKQAAAYLQQKLQEAQRTYGKKDDDSTALMAALSLSHDLLLLHRQAASLTAQLESDLEALKD